MNFMVKSGGMEEFKFGGALPCISGRGVGVNYFSQVSWLTLVENFVCNEAYSKLYPVPDWEPVEFFQLRGNV